jgi:hypothetical protein
MTILDGREEYAVAIWRTASDDVLTGRIE